MYGIPIWQEHSYLSSSTSTDNVCTKRHERLQYVTSDKRLQYVTSDKRLQYVTSDKRIQYVTSDKRL